MEFQETSLPGCVEICAPVHKDVRGRFVKVFRRDLFVQRRIATDFVEDYYSVSEPRVLRGLHFQEPPFDCAKLVFCVQGSVMDVALDLRNGSPTYGCHVVVQLSAQRGNMLYIPSGMAHGFYVDREPAMLVYKVTSVYSSQHDTGIRWDSAAIPWPNSAPVLSERDRGFVGLQDYTSPFVYTKPSDTADAAQHA